MNRLRDPRWLVILGFLGILGGVPAIQVLLELRRDDDVKALEILHTPPTAANLRAYERSLEEANWAARASRPWVQYAQFEWLRYGGAKVTVGTDGWYFYKPGLEYSLAGPAPTPPSGAPDDPLAAIVDFRDQLAARGIRLMLLPVPNKESVYPDRLTPRAASLRGVIAARTRQFLDRLQTAGVEWIDLFGLYAEERRRFPEDTRPSLYLAQDTHWSPAGIRLAAEATASRLLALGWVRLGETAYDERSAAVHRLGDIVRMLQVPLIERETTPETVPCRQVVRRDTGEVYRDFPTAEILVLGDSFCRVFQHDTPGGAGFIAHLAKGLRQPLLSLVNDGGGSTLVRQELQGRPAFLANRRVVLWEFVERDLGLGLGGWKLVPLPPPGTEPSPPPNQTVPGSRPSPATRPSG